MGVLAKSVCVFVILFMIYWVFIQPFIGKDFSYDDAVSYAIGGIILLSMSILANIYMVTALLIGTQFDGEKCMYSFLINMSLADLILTFIETPLTLFEHIALISPNSGIETIELIIRNRKLIRQFTFLAGILYAASLAQYCLLALLSAFMRVQQMTCKMVTVGLQLSWLYTVLCFTFDILYTHEKGWQIYHDVSYSATVELFVPAGIMCFSAVGLFLIHCRRPYQENVVPDKLILVLVLTFCLFRAPLIITTLLQQLTENTNPTILKIKKLTTNLYLFKYCLTPMIVYTFDQNAANLYEKLQENITRIIWMLKHRTQTETTVKYNQTDDKINIAMTLDEEVAELLTQQT